MDPPSSLLLSNNDLCCLTVNNIKCSLNIRRMMSQMGQPPSIAEDAMKHFLHHPLRDHYGMRITHHDAGETFTCGTIETERLITAADGGSFEPPPPRPCPRCKRLSCCPKCRRVKPCKRRRQEKRKKLHFFLSRSGTINFTGTRFIMLHAKAFFLLLPPTLLDLLNCATAKDLIPILRIDNISASGSLYHNGATDDSRGEEEEEEEEQQLDLRALQRLIVSDSNLSCCVTSSSFQAERFPALIIKLSQVGSFFGGTLSIFSTGSVVFVGVREFEHVEEVKRTFLGGLWKCLRQRRTHSEE